MLLFSGVFDYYVVGRCRCIVDTARPLDVSMRARAGDKLLYAVHGRPSEEVDNP